jgi:hypothetical protein
MPLTRRLESAVAEIWSNSVGDFVCHAAAIPSKPALASGFSGLRRLLPAAAERLIELNQALVFVVSRLGEGEFSVEASDYFLLRDLDLQLQMLFGNHS